MGTVKGARAKLPWQCIVFHDPSCLDELDSTAPVVTMQFAGLVAGAKAKVLLDTGAQGGHYLSEAFCTLHKIAVTPSTDTVKVGDGRDANVIGTAIVKVKIQGYHASLKCVVFDVVQPFDLVLGDGWLAQHAAVMSYQDRTCSIKHHAKHIVLKQQARPPVVLDGSTRLLTALQLKRAVRKGCETFLVVVTPKDETHSEVESFKSSLTDTSLSADLQALLKQYADVFPDELPGLAPFIPLW